MSVGIAMADPAAGDTVADLIGAADRALYAAKNDGRNRWAGPAFAGRVNRAASFGAVDPRSLG